MSEAIERSDKVRDEQDDDDDRHGPADEAQGTAAGGGAHGARIKHGRRPLLNAAGPSPDFRIEWGNGETSNGPSPAPAGSPAGSPRGLRPVHCVGAPRCW